MSAALVFPGLDDLAILATRFPALSSAQHVSDGRWSSWAEGRHFVLEVTTGTIEVRMSDASRDEKRANREFDRRRRDWTAEDPRSSAGLLRSWVALLPHSVNVDKAAKTGRFYLPSEVVDVLMEYRADPNAPKKHFVRRLEVLAAWYGEDARQGEESVGGLRRVITEWTKKSRRAMIKAFSSVDLSKLAELEGRKLGMITLTYPGGWEELVPTGRVHKDNMARFWKRWERAWGKVAGLWKLEFQRRGAPHVHFFTAVPQSAGFREWLSMTWAEVVGAVGEDREKHELAGTGIDYGKDESLLNPRRVIGYFLKYAGKSDGKEYQNQAPGLWVGEDRGPGRFWGVKGLKRSKVIVALSVDDYMELRSELAAEYEGRSVAARRERARKKGLSERLVEKIEGARLKHLESDSKMRGGWIAHEDPIEWVLGAAERVRERVLGRVRVPRTYIPFQHVPGAWKR